MTNARRVSVSTRVLKQGTRRVPGEGGEDRVVSARNPRRLSHAQVLRQPEEGSRLLLLTSYVPDRLRPAWIGAWLLMMLVQIVVLPFRLCFEGGATTARVLLSLSDAFFALDADSGAERWRRTTGAMVGSSPAVFGTRVYVGCEDGYLYAFDVEDDP